MNLVNQTKQENNEIEELELNELNTMFIKKNTGERITKYEIKLHEINKKNLNNLIANVS